MKHPGGSPRNGLLDELVGLQRHLAASVERLDMRRGQVLAETGQGLDAVYFPHDCVISLSVPMGEGAAAEAATIGREGMYGFIASFGGGVSLARGVVQVGGAASRLPLAPLQAAFEREPAVRDLCLRSVQVLIGQVFQSVGCASTHPADRRLCRWLLMLHDRACRDELDLTHEFLSEMLGVRRATVTVATVALQQEGVIAQRRGRLTILDRPRLESRACECYRVVRDHYAALLPS